MEFKQDPDYDYLRGLFKSIMIRHNHKYDLEFDWLKKDNSERKAPYFIDRLNSSLNALNSNSSMQVNSKESNLNNDLYLQKIKFESTINKDKSKFQNYNK